LHATSQELLTFLLRETYCIKNTMSLTVAHTAFGGDAQNGPLTVHSKAEFYGAEYEPKIEAVPLSVSLSSGSLAGSIAMPVGSFFANALKVLIALLFHGITLFAL